MKTFDEWLAEAADPHTLYKYVKYIQSQEHPTLDDLRTLANLLVKSKSNYSIFADLWPVIESILPKLSPQEQEQAKRLFSNLNIADPQYERKMRLRGMRKFASLQELEDFIYKEMEKDWGGDELMKMLQSPEHSHLWQQLDIKVKEDLTDWLKKLSQQQQPSFAQAINDMRKSSRDKPSED